MPLLLLLLIIPLIEVALFIEIGGIIGVWPTIAIAILTAILGSYLLGRQGLGALMNVRSQLAAGVNPGRLLGDGAMILIAGVLLLTPGFLTDAVGLLLLIAPGRGWIFRGVVWGYRVCPVLGRLLLIPPVRGWIFRRIASRYTVRSAVFRHGSPRRDGGVVEGEFEEVKGRGGSDGHEPDGADRPPIGHDRG